MDSNNLDSKNINTNKHARQTFWQIVFPFLLTLAAVCTAAFFLFRANVQGGVDIRVWADISTIILILPFLLLVLLFFVIVLIIFLILTRVFEPIKNAFFKLNRTLSAVSKTSMKVCKAIQKLFIEIGAYSSFFSKR